MRSDQLWAIAAAAGISGMAVSACAMMVYTERTNTTSCCHAAVCPQNRAISEEPVWGSERSEDAPSESGISWNQATARHAKRETVQLTEIDDSSLQVVPAVYGRVEPEESVPAWAASSATPSTPAVDELNQQIRELKVAVRELAAQPHSESTSTPWPKPRLEHRGPTLRQAEDGQDWIPEEASVGRVSYDEIDEVNHPFRARTIPTRATRFARTPKHPSAAANVRAEVEDEEVVEEEELRPIQMQISPASRKPRSN